MAGIDNSNSYGTNNNTPVELTTQEKRFPHKPRVALAPNNVVKADVTNNTPVELTTQEKGFSYKLRVAMAPKKTNTNPNLNSN